MRARARLKLCEQVADVGLDGLLREEEPHTDLAVHESVGDQLKNLDLTRRRLLLQLLQRAGERNDLGALVAASLRNRVEAPAVVDITGQDLLAFGRVHDNRDIGLAARRL
jgi:hypothetical protein